MFCSQCGKEIDSNSAFCKYCGYKMNSTVNDAMSNNAQYNRQQALFQQEILNRLDDISTGSNKKKSSAKAGIFAILFGIIGVHEFYLGNVGLGILCIIATLFNLILMSGFFPIIALAVIEYIIILIRAITLFASTDKDLTEAYNEKKK